MFYTVNEMEGKSTVSGSSYSLKLGSYNPDYQCTLLAVTKDQFDSVKVGDKIEIAIAPSAEFAAEVAKRVADAELEASHV